MLDDVLNLFVNNNRKISELDVDLSVEQEELISHQAKYLCIITSAYLETRIKEIGKEYKDNGGISGCKRFLNGMRNPKWCNILSYLVNIDHDLIRALDYEIRNKDQIIAHLDLLSISRNKIAHGEAVDISIDEMRGIIESVNILMNAIDKIVRHHLHEIEA